MSIAKTSTPGIGDGVGAFFERCGFSPDVQDQCWALTRELFPGARIEEARPQGYCSYTLCVGHDRIVQFRAPVHKLRMCVAEAACEVYGELAPRTQLLAVLRPSFRHSSKACNSRLHGPDSVDEGVVLDDDQHGLNVVSMARIRGTSLSEARASPAGLLAPLEVEERHCSLICQFARIIATATHHPRQESDLEVSDLRGRVGGSLRWRLEQMHAQLPERFRSVTGMVITKLGEITSLPWVLTHGDFVPANIMVESSHEIRGRLSLTGLLDWAETEYLPLGVGLYGLEELLGEVGASGQFSYYPEGDELRSLFWAQMEVELSRVGLRLDERSRELIHAAHVLGVLLWHGFAFDDGNLDRVVQEGVDDEEILRLDLFLAGCGVLPGDG